MTTWHWVRHGPTHEKNFVGWRDVPADLSDVAQLERLHAYLPSQALLVSSDLIRASATADALENGRERLPNHVQLREIHFGEWDGKHFEEVANSHPKLSRAFWETPGDIQAPNGESWNMALDRISGAVDILNSSYPDAHIIAVAHFGAILTQVQRADSLRPDQAIAHRIDNLSVTTINHGPDGWSVERINHLP